MADEPEPADDETPFEHPAVMNGYPLSKEEKEQVKAALAESEKASKA
jgi:hypothetical protein